MVEIMSVILGRRKGDVSDSLLLVFVVLCFFEMASSASFVQIHASVTLWLFEKWFTV